MAKITINKARVIHRNIPNIETVEFDYLGRKVYSAEKVERLFGVFVSQPIMGDSSLVSWKELSMVAQKPEGTDVFVYLKASATEDGLTTAEWTGPYLNSVNDISNIKNQWLQFVVVLVNEGDSTHQNYEHIEIANTPILQNLQLSYYSSENAVRFYTRAFDLGFTPKHVLLTYNGDISSDSIVRFAISGFDSTNTSDYQYIDPNKIEELSDLSLLSSKIKVMIEMIGDSSTLLTIHEFALMFSGNEQLRLNDISSSSSESSLSSLSSSISSESSSSISSESSSSSSSSSSNSSSSSSSSSISSESSSSSSSSSISSESSSSISSESSSSSSSSLTGIGFMAIEIDFIVS
jgi:hypothetical protein